MHWFLDPIQKHYADFEGRVGRQEYWMFIATYVAAYFAVGFVARIMQVDLLPLVFSLALVIPNIAITARRLHDIGKSGWWQLLFFIPLIGLIIMIAWLATDTVQADNEYGSPARPKVVGGVTPSAAAAAVPMAESVHAETPAQTPDSMPVTQTEVVQTESNPSSNNS